MLAVLAWSVFGSVERGVSLDAVVVYGGQRHEVSAPANGTVVAVPVALGDSIKAGQVIARVRVREAATLAAPAGEGRVPDHATTVEILGELIESMVAAATAGYLEQEIVSPYEGDLVALHLAPGQPVSAGAAVAGIRAGGGTLEAHAYVTPAQAAQFAAGMSARVQMAGGRTDEISIPAEVTEVSERPVAPPTSWMGGNGPARPHLVRVAMTTSADTARWPVEDGTAVALRIVVGRGSFLSLLMPPSRG